MARRFYRRWVLANAASEALGLGTTFLVGWLVAPHVEALAGVRAVVLTACAAVALGVLLEGVVVGGAQEYVLRPFLPRLTPGRWVWATMIGAGAAWLVGMIPSTVMALQPPASSATAALEPPPFLQYTLAAALGLVTGPILGVAQWTVLRQLVPHAGRWLGANALAWAVGMPVIFAGMDQVPWSGPRVPFVVALYGVCGMTGALVGAVHGRVLETLLAVNQGPTVLPDERVKLAKNREPLGKA